jgi:hypothetical protein
MPQGKDRAAHRAPVGSLTAGGAMTDPHGTQDMDQQPPGMAPFEDVESAVTREVEIVAERFPDADVAEVDAVVRDVYAELRAEADVETHLLALTRHRVYDRLEEQGHPFQPPISDGRDSDAASDTGPPAEAEQAR